MFSHLKKKKEALHIPFLPPAEFQLYQEKANVTSRKPASSYSLLPPVNSPMTQLHSHKKISNCYFRS